MDGRWPAPWPRQRRRRARCPVPDSQWNSTLFACLGRNDEFCSSDLEVCLLGSFVPCMLYGSNVERMEIGPSTYANHCLPYTGLYFLGNSLFGWKLELSSTLVLIPQPHSNPKEVQP